MIKEDFVQKVRQLCSEQGIKPTSACRDSGVGSSFLSDINRGQIPSVAKVQMLAQYLGVTTSELLGEKITPAAQGDGLSVEETELINLFRDLNEEGQAALIATARGLTASGLYIKIGPDGVGKEA